MKSAPRLKAPMPIAPGTFNHGGDLCCGFFKTFYDSGRLVIPLGARVLEIGCAEWDWLTPMKALRPDLHLTGLDQRDPGKRPGADVLVRGDVRDRALFPHANFDVIVAVSVIEHVGIGRYGDVVDPEGDRVAIGNLRHWLKPSGCVYLDVPWRPEGPSTPFRQYNDADFASRITQGWTVVDCDHFSPEHPDGPYIAVVLRP